MSDYISIVLDEDEPLKDDDILITLEQGILSDRYHARDLGDRNLKYCSIWVNNSASRRGTILVVAVVRVYPLS